MELSVYDIIIKPIITSKSVVLYKKFGQYTFEVHSTVSKIIIKRAVEKLWNVKVDQVRVIKLPAKVRSFNRRKYTTSPLKKAIFTLKQGYKIEIPGLFESMMPQNNVKNEVLAAGE